MQFPLVRSVLYIPALNTRALAKAETLPTDSVIIDLEDAIPPAQKTLAREQLCAWLKTSPLPNKNITVRINAIGTPWYKDDICCLKGLHFHSLMVPKIRHPDDIILIAKESADALGATPPLWAMAETPDVLLYASLFALAHRAGTLPRIEAWALGANDLMKETGTQLVPNRETMQHWLATTILLARSTQSLAIDGVFNNLDDGAGFAMECTQGRNFGFDGKTIIHPRQLETANTIYSPTTAQIADARALHEAFELPENRERGVIAFNGRMAERLHLHIAKKILQHAEAIQKQGF